MNTVIDGIDFGPLAALIGSWKGDRGLDIVPEPDGVEKNAYFEALSYSVVGDVTNAESQVLAVISYHQSVSRHSTGEVFHDQTGYWSWDKASGMLMHSFIIPRAVAVVAEGLYTGPDSDGTINMKVSTAQINGVAESSFMRDNASTTAFSMRLTVKGDSLSYAQSTMLDIYGREFDHTDVSELQRVS